MQINQHNVDVVAGRELHTLVRQQQQQQQQCIKRNIIIIIIIMTGIVMSSIVSYSLGLVLLFGKLQGASKHFR